MQVVELWTRRHFRCDCGNSKFGHSICKLQADKEIENAENMYNQNYKGLYCTCHRVYPDPEGEALGEMLQCCICEDWFHELHLGLSSSLQVRLMLVPFGFLTFWKRTFNILKKFPQFFTYYMYTGL